MPIDNRIILVCPECKRDLSRLNPSSLTCSHCQKTFFVLNNVISFIGGDGPNNGDIEFYKDWQKKVDNLKLEDEKRKYVYKKLSSNIIYLGLRDFFRKNIKPIKNLYLLYDYFNKRRDYFFEDFFKDKPRGLILDLGCGKGSDLFGRFGQVIGVDFNIDLLLAHNPEAGYLIFIHSNALKLPFRDGQFDYLVSSDFLEHISSDRKEVFYKELKRVLRGGGEMAHFVTADSKNPWFRFAHRYPDLFKKSLIEDIGGHYGLELPRQLIKNIEAEGFKLIRIKKMLWEPVEFALRFNNEYKYKSILIKAVVKIIERLMESEFIFVIINIPVGIVYRLFEFFMPLDYSNKLGIAFKKGNG